MSRVARTLAVMALIGLMLGSLAIGGLVAWADGTLGQAVITVNGNQVTLAQLHGSPALLGVAALVVVIVLVLVVPLAVVLPLLAVGLALTLAFLAIVGTVALVLSPLLLLGWLAWRLARPAKATRVVAS